MVCSYMQHDTSLVTKNPIILATRTTSTDFPQELYSVNSGLLLARLLAGCKSELHSALFKKVGRLMQQAT